MALLNFKKLFDERLNQEFESLAELVNCEYNSATDIITLKLPINKKIVSFLSGFIKTSEEAEANVEWSFEISDTKTITPENYRPVLEWLLTNRKIQIPTTINLTNLQSFRDKIVLNLREEENEVEANAFIEKISPHLKKVGLPQIHCYKKPTEKTVKENKMNDYPVSFDESATKIVANIFRLEMRKLANGSIKYQIGLTDGKNEVLAVLFKKDPLNCKKGDWVELNGKYTKDKYVYQGTELYFKAYRVKKVAAPSEMARKDNSPEKRVELHLHSKMSTMDGVTNISKYIAQVAKWGHKAIAITDHENVQAFPEAYAAATQHPDLKIIYGVEANLVEKNIRIVTNCTAQKIVETTFIVFDLETTGLNCQTCEIIEFGAVRVTPSGETDSKQMFIKPNKTIPDFITKMTKITNDMVANEQPMDERVKEIYDYVKDGVLVAHNADFDIGFLKVVFKKHLHIDYNPTYVDTMQMSRAMHPKMKYHRLGNLARSLRIPYDDKTAHRADEDTEVLRNCFHVMLAQLQKDGISTLEEINNQLQNSSLFARNKPKHVSILVKNQTGLKDLFKIISLSNTKYFTNKPTMPREIISRNRKNLLIGSGCVNGEIFEAAINSNTEKLAKEMRWYDYVEVQPPAVYNHLLARNYSLDDIHSAIKLIIRFAKKAKKTVVATSDAHYLHPHEKKFRQVFIHSKGIGGALHPLYSSRITAETTPDQHLRTTTEMISEFGFLKDAELVKQIVITNSQKISDLIAVVQPIKKEIYPPTRAGVDQEIKKTAFKRAHQLYGQKLPTIVQERLDRELKAIIQNQYGIIFWSASYLVNKSREKGYLVGSRGSVGSSLVAFMLNITEVNALAPHYRCPNCFYTDFEIDSQFESGFDLPGAECPKCQTPLIGDGQNILFETFMGYEGNKTPDIDLNFSSEYQAQAHLEAQQLFGKNHTFRAGTISTIANKTAFGYVKAYLENLKKSGASHYENISRATLEYLVENCVGVKRTTGQHPGGVVIIPENMEVEDFTPINFPADDKRSEWLTTHFEFDAIHNNLLKLDLLGHVDPTAIYYLEKMTGVKAATIPFHDSKVMGLFNSTTSINLQPADLLIRNESKVLLEEKNAAIGIPEFGTSFVREMLKDANPQSFADLVRISGLSHGTDVWTQNAQKWIKNKNATLKEVIAARDDIMIYLQKMGIPSLKAFTIMENVRKGKGLTRAEILLLEKAKVPNWYIESCEKIKYMFPKAHAVAYVMMAWRVAWFKVHHPVAYYALYFSIRCDVFDLETLLQGKTAIVERLKGLLERRNARGTTKLSPKEKDLLSVLEVAFEMHLRGIRFAPLSLEHSQASHFVPNYQEKTIYPAFSAVDGLGDTAALTIIKARDDKPFTSVADFKNRTTVNKTVFEKITKLNLFADLPEENQTKIS